MLRTSAGSRSATFIKVSMADTMNTCQSGHQIFQFKNMVCILEREGTLDCKFHWYPKFYNLVILFVDLKTLRHQERLRR